jgi:porphobilinogen synthase
MNSIERPRRLRRSSAIRDLVQETHLSAADLVWPVFVTEGQGQREAIDALPGCERMSLDILEKEVARLAPMGLRALALFPCIEDRLKNSKASEALNVQGLIPKALRALKKRFPEILLITDVALDPYSSDGHDGLVKNGEVLNDESVAVLAQQALVQAQAGADFVAPSDMMDGRIAWIRKTLDDAGLSHCGIISYCCKYASGFYGPFRSALASAPRFGDKKTYQMSFSNRREILREVRLDRKEGADILLVKPALSYMDVISLVRRNSDLPVAAYNVSGEYAMVKFGAKAGVLDEQTVVMEILGSMKRAGADIIFSYHTPDVLQWLSIRK